MNIEDVRYYALSLANATEDLFDENWITFRIGGKWFLVVQLNAPAPRIAVKLAPDDSITLRETHDGIRPAFHMNKTHWSDLYLQQLDEKLIKQLIRESYQLVLSRLPKSTREKLIPPTTAE